MPYYNSGYMKSHKQILVNFNNNFFLFLSPIINQNN